MLFKNKNKYNNTPNISSIYQGIINQLPKFTNTSWEQLVNYGIHIGHSYRNTTQYSAWMLYGVREGVHFINMFKFIYQFRGGLFALDGTIRSQSPIWFVNLDKSSTLFVKFPANSCGEFWITENWIRGMVSNYRVICGSVRRVSSIARVAWNRKLILLQSNFQRWGFTRNTWPRALFVSNVKQSYGACHEAHKLNIPCLGIVDTDSPISLVSLAIPGNDEAITALVFYNSMVSNYILYKKFAFINVWYSSQLKKNSENIKKILDWHSKNNKKPITHFLADIQVNPFTVFMNSITLFAAQGHWQYKTVDKFAQISKAKKIDIKHKVIDYLSNNINLLNGLSKAVKLNKAIYRSINKKSRKWWLKIKKNPSFINRSSGLKRQNTLNFVGAYNRGRYYRKVLRNMSRISQSMKEAEVLWTFYQSFGAIYLSNLVKSRSIFNNLVNRSIKAKRQWKSHIVRYPWYLYKENKNIVLDSNTTFKKNKYRWLKGNSLKSPYGRKKFIVQYSKIQARLLYLSWNHNSRNSKLSFINEVKSTKVEEKFNKIVKKIVWRY